MEVHTEKSKIMTNSMKNISRVVSMNGRKFEKVTSLKYLRYNPVQGWHLLSRNPHKDCLSNDNNGQIKQDLVKQHHQLCK